MVGLLTAVEKFILLIVRCQIYEGLSLMEEQSEQESRQTVSIINLTSALVTLYAIIL